MESAQAEVEERKEHELEEEAIKHGDNKLAAHLRGALVPGDEIIIHIITLTMY